jgi:hypothetical protein
MRCLHRSRSSSIAINYSSSAYHSRRCFSNNNPNNTYYDSQSGLHIPIHNEQEISLILNKSQDESFVPIHLYKEDPGSDMPDILQSLTQKGIHGIILPPTRFPRDVRNLQTLSNIAPSSPNFTIFVSGATSAGALKNTLAAKNNNNASNLSLILELFSKSDDDDPYDHPMMMMEEEEEEERNEYAQQQQPVGININTTLVIRKSAYTTEASSSSSSMIAIASRTATRLDRHGDNYIWLEAPDDNADAAIRLCEELVYLDVAGPTIKSRLLLDTSNPEVVEEAMFSGVNKFVINGGDGDDDDDEQQKSIIETIEEIAKEQGKRILRR